MKTLDQATIDEFTAFVSSAGRSQATVKAYSSDLRTFTVWATTTGAKPTSTSAAAWLTESRAELAPKTTHRRLTSLRAFMDWAGIEQGVLADYKLPTPKRPVPHPLTGGMDDVRAMLRVARNTTQSTLIALQGFGGMRIAEALSVDVDDVDVDHGIITVRGKGDKERDIPFDVNGEAFAVIVDRVNEVGTGRLVDMPDRTARYTITALAKKAGVSSYTKAAVSSHDLRATAATALYVASGHDIRLVQEFLGHASAKQTEVYVGVSKDRFAKAVSAL